MIKITDKGKENLGSLNSQLQDLFTRALRRKEAPLMMAGKHMRVMMQIVQAGTRTRQRSERRNAKKKNAAKDEAGDLPGSQSAD